MMLLLMGEVWRLWRWRQRRMGLRPRGQLHQWINQRDWLCVQRWGWEFQSVGGERAINGREADEARSAAAAAAVDAAAMAVLAARFSAWAAQQSSMEIPWPMMMGVVISNYREMCPITLILYMSTSVDPPSWCSSPKTIIVLHLLFNNTHILN